jgi:hypothetical protein
MLYREVIAVCSQIYTKHTNTLCGKNVELFNVKPVVCKLIIGLWKLNISQYFLGFFAFSIPCIMIYLTRCKPKNTHNSL